MSVVVPLNYAQVLGLKGRDLYLDPIITQAYDELFHRELHPGFSAIAKLGKEKLLFAAREGLRNAKGRVSLAHPDITIEPVLLPGTMALLNQVEHYELVIQLGQQAKNISNKDLKATQQGSERDYRRDVCLAAALANCGLARDALEGGLVSLGYARLEEALKTIEQAPGGGKSMAPDLCSNIMQALMDLRSDAIVDTLKEALDLSQVTNRKAAIRTLVSMMMAPKGGQVESDLVAKVLSYLTSHEIVDMLDWNKIEPNTSWCTPDIVSIVGVAHIVSGFTHRKPYVVAKGRKILATARAAQADISVQLAICEMLLGEPHRAVGILEEDEKLGLKLKSAARIPEHPARKVMPANHLPDRDDLMAFIRYHSQSSNDLLPGLCLFAELWLAQVAFPRMRDTKERPTSPSLADYFESPSTVKYLSSKSFAADWEFLGVVSRAFTALKKQAMSSIPALSSMKRLTPRAKKTGVNALAFLIMTAVGYSLINRGTKINISASSPATGETFLGTAATQKKQKKKQKNTKSNVASPSASSTGIDTASSTSSSSADSIFSLSKSEAKDLLDLWAEIKAEAMGPRHNTSRLSMVLADPMLKAVTSEAKEASKSGWFWNIRPLKVKVDSITADDILGEEAVIVATIDESADLWATNGKKGDSYKTSYRVEYTAIRDKSRWKITSALVIGK